MQKKYDKAAAMYKKAISMALSELANHESTFTQAKRLMKKLQPTAEEKLLILDAFKHLPDYASALAEWFFILDYNISVCLTLKN